MSKKLGIFERINKRKKDFNKLKQLDRIELLLTREAIGDIPFFTWTVQAIKLYLVIFISLIVLATYLEPDTMRESLQALFLAGSPFLTFFGKLILIFFVLDIITIFITKHKQKVLHRRFFKK